MITGNIIQMADKVMEVLDNKYLIRPIHYEGLQRIEPMEIPEEALREIIFNAIIHKEYPGYSTQMRVYDDRIWLWNSGGLPEGITFEQFLGAHSSCPRNRLIARAFYLAGFIESWGRGINKIKTKFIGSGLEAPVYKEEMGGMSVYITRRKGLYGEDGTVNGTVNIIDNKIVSTNFDGVNDTVNDTVKRILKVISNNEAITYDEMSEVLKISRRTIARHIKTMTKLFLIVREGSDKSGYWYVTEKGKKIINKYN